MKRWNILLAICSIMFLVSAGCGDDSGGEGGSGGGSGNPDANTGGNPDANTGGNPDANTGGGADAGALSYATDILPLLGTCTPCHLGTQEQGGLNFANGPADLVDQSVAPPTGSGNTLIVSGDPAMSFFVEKLKASPSAGSRMPLGGTPLSDEDIATIEAWITAGAAP